MGVLSHRSPRAGKVGQCCSIIVHGSDASCPMGEHLLARCPSIARGLFRRGPTKDRHELTLRRAVLCCQSLTGLAQAVRRAVG